MSLVAGNFAKKFLLTVTMLIMAGGASTNITSAEETPKQQTREETIRAVSDNFSAIPTMTGEFVQFGPNGEQSGGVFYIERPGKIRFNYESPAAIEVISNGKTVAIHNKKLNTWDFYPLSKTPLKLLLDKKLEVDSEAIRDIVSEPDLTTIVMGDEQIFGDSEITLMFDPLSYDLRQWTIKDTAGKETSVMVFNITKNVRISEKFFKFDELAIRRQQQESRN
ncbi:MAG: outer-membrane lipoprotein carrier protein LolA [Rhizobiaceae bacterium]